MKKKNNTSRKNKKIFTIIICVFIVLVILCALVAVFLIGKLNRINFVRDEPVEFVEQGTQGDESALSLDDVYQPEESAELKAPAEKPKGELMDDEGIVNLIFIGTDEKIPNSDDRGRGDCIIICSLNADEGTVKLISVERAVACYVPSKDGYDLITHAYKYGGGELIQKTLEENFLIPVAGYVSVDYDAVIAAIDLLGGVDITLTDVEAAALNGIIDSNSFTRVEVYPGVNHLDGYDALQYSRQRYIDSDWQRVVRQRNTIQAMLNAAKGKSLLELNEIANQLLPMVNTNLTTGQILKLLLSAPKFVGTEIDSMTVPKSDDIWSVELWNYSYGMGIDWEKYSGIVQEFIAQ